MSELTEAIPAYVRKILSDPRQLHDSARIYSPSEAEQLKNKWVLWWSIDNPTHEWRCDEVVFINNLDDRVYFEEGYSRSISCTLFYVIPAQ